MKLFETFQTDVEGGGKHHCPYCLKSRNDDDYTWKDIEHEKNCIIGDILKELDE